ncbi:MAG: hypothetical protein K8S99_03895 [Planctomycetes bacterium]|nr:hypothetical protein [Planctomycetota bacterium]
MGENTTIQTPELEQACSECDGVGEVRIGERSLSCSACDGTGTVATEFGQRVLDLVWKNFDGITRS